MKFSAKWLNSNEHLHAYSLYVKIAHMYMYTNFILALNSLNFVQIDIYGQNTRSVSLWLMIFTQQLLYVQMGSTPINVHTKENAYSGKNKHKRFKL